MAEAVTSRPRVSVDGKFFRLGPQKFYVKGIAYGPFRPNAQGEAFLAPAETARDLTHIRELGVNVVRVYNVPPRWFLDLAGERELKVFIDIPWNRHLSFDSANRRADAREAVRAAVLHCNRHPAVFAFSVANEIPADIVRWTGTRGAANFIDELIAEAKRVDPQCLCTYSNFPPTEFLHPQNVDFVCFNVYLHHEQSLKAYLARLQLMADSKPLVLGEFGVDSLREGESRKCEILSWQIEATFRGGLAGTVVFTYTDEWFRGGHLVEDWQMGLVTADRVPKASLGVVQAQFAIAPHFPLPRQPRVSVVVASFNGERTLKACLESLTRLNYPDYEVILVDDGSNDGTTGIAARYPSVRYIRHSQNAGLSVARNTGIAAATGEIVAFTDSDCRADEDWLYYLVGALLDTEFAGVGGPNLFPPEDSAVAASVMASPGGPAHVMLTDRQAEHIPGCNMAFYKWALEEIGGFDAIYTRAGDDVDVCWRLQQAGYRIGFSPAAFVWHYRRSTVPAYLRQQAGYGDAEALLVRKHPENFNSFGGGIWRGRIYSSSRPGVELRPPVIYHGLFGSAGFQKLYASDPPTMLMFCTTLEYHLFVTLPLWVISSTLPYFLPVALASLMLSTGICVVAGFQAVLPRGKVRWWSRPLVALLFFLQPIVRGWARYRGRFAMRPFRLSSRESLDSVALRASRESLDEVSYWSEERVDRLQWVTAVLHRLEQRGWPVRTDAGWSEYDLELSGGHWSDLQLTTMVEDHPRNRSLIRCRLRGRWSLMARLTFWSGLGLELMLIGALDPARFWPWLILLTVPVWMWFQNREGRRVQSVTVVLLDELAKERGFARVGRVMEHVAGRTEAAKAAAASGKPGASPFAKGQG